MILNVVSINLDELEFNATSLESVRFSSSQTYT